MSKLGLHWLLKRHFCSLGLSFFNFMLTLFHLNLQDSYHQIFQPTQHAFQFFIFFIATLFKNPIFLWEKYPSLVFVFMSSFEIHLLEFQGRYYWTLSVIKKCFEFRQDIELRKQKELLWKLREEKQKKLQKGKLLKPQLELLLGCHKKKPILGLQMNPKDSRLMQQKNRNQQVLFFFFLFLFVLDGFVITCFAHAFSDLVHLRFFPSSEILIAMWR